MILSVERHLFFDFTLSVLLLSGGNFKSLQKWQKILVAICKWSVFGGYSSSFAEATEDKLGSHAQTTISNSSTIFFQPNFAGLLKLPLNGISFFELKKMECRKKV